jgi:CRISPR/Cas system-associated exonuclease Cas4 (RecB family)
MKILNSCLKEEGSLDVEHIKHDPIKPNPAEIGISNPAVPDFIIPETKIVGDIKTGVNFAPNHQLTCAGYALAYEDQNKGAKIDWGIVYFFPTRNPSAYVKPITFAQVYIFPIDDQLRRWFLHSRNEAYKIVSSPTIPQFPETPHRTHCSLCKFYKFCKENGLETN